MTVATNPDDLYELVLKTLHDNATKPPATYQSVARAIEDAIKREPDTVMCELGFEKQPRICLDLYDEAWVPVTKEGD